MTSDLMPGKSIRITVTKTPQRTADVKTVRRLMRMNTDAQRALRHAQEQRRREGIRRRIRAGRFWAVRPKVGYAGLHPEEGAEWTMRYRPQVARDLEAIEPFVKIEPVED